MRLTHTQPTIHHHRPVFVISLSLESGHEGQGECAPLPGFSHETIETVEKELTIAKQVLVDFSETITAPFLTTLSQFHDYVYPFHFSPSVMFGLESALLDAYSYKFKTPHHLLIHASSPSSVSSNVLLMGSKDEVWQKASTMAKKGMTVFKLKLGHLEAIEALQLVASVRDRIGPSSQLRLDINRAWSLNTAQHMIQDLLPYNISYIEEPLQYPHDLRSLFKKTPIPIALDETLQQAESIFLQENHIILTMQNNNSDTCVKLKASNIGAFVLKPTLIGGISRTIQFANIAKQLGIPVVISSSYESPIGTSCLSAIASGLSPNDTHGIDV
ncbi:MAG: o-succinylbenzoate synthase [Candidatus Margulisbacteria bacterium]|nr:o-succinylbenzoate synthase [Candidatus Margulisiibacteriota bacterium]